jgi:alpha-ketoglutarate-dependent taurine dioxygenase
MIKNNVSTTRTTSAAVASNNRRSSTYQQQQQQQLWKDNSDKLDTKKKVFNGDTSSSSSSSYAIEISNNEQEISITLFSSPYGNDHDGCDNDDESLLFLDDTVTTWTFAAPILWVNDPKYIHPSSGQRLRTIGTYSTSIGHGEIVHFDAGDHELSASLVHPPPVRGSYHPRGGIYEPLRKKNDTPRSTTRTLLKVVWKSSSDGGDDEESYYDLEWLISHANSNRIGKRRQKQQKQQNEERYPIQLRLLSSTVTMQQDETIANTTRVTKDVAIQAFNDDGSNVVEDSIRTFEYQDIMKNDDILCDGMSCIYEYGAILIRNAPVYVNDDEMNDSSKVIEQQESVVGDLGKRFSGGKLSHGSLYGDIFHVRSKPGAENIAYTNVPLPPHQDLTYYESKPFLQLLHCMNNSNDKDNCIIGGESVLIDAMAAAEELRQVAPDLFDILCRTEATFLKQRQGADMVSPKPHIVTDPSLGHVVAINWSPPFEGPFQLDPYTPVEDYVRAYQAFECMIDAAWNINKRGDETSSPSRSSLLSTELECRLREYAQRYTWEYALQRKDVLIFNNQRMLHGRRGFTSLGNGERHLIGCYTDAMDTTSEYRQLLRNRSGANGGGFGRRNPGSGCRWM